VKIGYGKIGRSWKLDPTKGTTTGGDADVARALHVLSRLYPQDEFVLVGRNSGENPQEVGYPENVTNPWETSRGLLARVNAEYKRLSGDDETGKRPMSTAHLQELMRWHEENTVPLLFGDLHQVIMWAGQHGSSNIPLPQTSDRSELTYPQDTFIHYASYLFLGMNAWVAEAPDERDVIWLNPDPRNYLKFRDLKEPLKNPVIAQFDQTRQLKHERYGDETEPPKGIKWDKQGGVWVAKQTSVYGALELTALPHPSLVTLSTDHAARYDFGMIVNENRAYGGKLDRGPVIKDWVLQFWPDAEVFGKWSDKGKEILGRPDIRPCPYEYLGQVLQRWRATLTTPASGSGWATAKPWECFAYGTVCFFHPEYDTQGHIVPTIEQLAATDFGDFHDLFRALRVETPEQLKKRVDWLRDDPAAWQWVIAEQRRYFEQSYALHKGGVRMITERLTR